MYRVQCAPGGGGVVPFDPGAAASECLCCGGPADVTSCHAMFVCAMQCVTHHTIMHASTNSEQLINLPCCQRRRLLTHS